MLLPLANQSKKNSVEKNGMSPDNGKVQDVDYSIKKGHIYALRLVSRTDQPLGRSQQRRETGDSHSSKHLRLDAAGLLQPALGERRGELDALVHKALDSAGTGSLQLGVQVSSSV